MALGLLLVPVILSTLAKSASTPIAEISARDQASKTIRAMRRTIGPDDFLRVQRDETLEEALSMAAWRVDTLAFIYRATQEGKEITGRKSGTGYYFRVK
jgi:hypothetical protein